jgi:Tol biopolymer transport system component
MTYSVFCLLTSVFWFLSPAAAQTPRPKVRTQIVLVDINGPLHEIVLDRPGHFEAPNWSPDGKYLLVNSEGRLWMVDPQSDWDPKPVDTGRITGVNNDHGISPDGKWFAFSAGHIYLMSSSGGAPRQVTSATPSYYHGWSPDGATLAYCAQRGGNFDIYAISRDGGPERRLTTHAAQDDGPDYSHDGRWIYFNSDRSGSMDIWRMPAQGAGANDAQAERVTSDEYEDWFPHPSPDGKWLIFLSYQKGTKGHPANQNVVIRRMTLEAGKPGKIDLSAKAFGGQGTLNVNSWERNSKRFALARYILIQ